MKIDCCMDEIIKLLDENIEYVKHELINDTINIYVISNRKDVVCPFCIAIAVSHPDDIQCMGVVTLKHLEERFYALN